MKHSYLIGDIVYDTTFEGKTFAVFTRLERLIDLIINRDYWEIIDVQTIIVMSISYILSKEILSETKLCESIWCQIQCLNCRKPEYRYMIC